MKLSNHISKTLGIGALLAAVMLSIGLADVYAQRNKASRSTPTPSKTTNNQGEGTTINLVDTDIRELINMVSKATGKNFIIDPRVKSKVTVVSSHPMRKDELYEIFLSILQVHGYAAVPGVGITKIVPDTNAKQGPIPSDPVNSFRNPNDQLITRVVKIEHVAANQLVVILRPLIPQQGSIAAYAQGNVLVISDRVANMKRILSIIDEIDQPGSDQVEIIRLENASATEMVQVITQLYSKQTKGGPATNKPSLTADERTNSILITGDNAVRARIRRIVNQLDTPLEAGGNTKVVFLNYADAKELVKILTGISAKTAARQEQNARTKGGGAKTGKNDIDIQADEANNAIVITAPSAVIRVLEAIIKQLDIPRAQVLIEAIIVDVSTNMSRELGTQLLVDGSEDGTGPIGGSIFTDSINLATLVGDTPSIGNGLTLGIGDSGASNKFALLLRTLEGNSATNVLSTPSLVTMDNVEAELVVGRNVPFKTGSFTGSGGGSSFANPFSTIKREDVGITLKVKPKINEGDRIKLEIEQEVSSVEADSTDNSDGPTTTKRKIKTEIMVKDGQVVILGGLIEDRFTDTHKQVPILGSIPFLGRLFSFTDTKKEKVNLMVFIRPMILTDTLTAEYATSHKYSLIKKRQLEANINKNSLIKDGSAELPDIEILLTPTPLQSESSEPANTEDGETNQRSE